MRIAVVGAGVAGLSAAWFAREMGAEVTCFERTNVMSQRSAGSTRIFRIAHATADMAALAQQARRLYQEWEERCGQTLIGRDGVVISDDRARSWQAALAAVGAPHRVVVNDPAALRVPATQPPGSALIDDGGGVLYAGRTGEFLARSVGSDVVAGQVYAIEDQPAGVLVRASSGDLLADAVLLCAGAGTAMLAEQVGLYTPTALVHHVRCSFTLRAPSAGLSCWIGTSRRGLATYQHRTAGGRWAIGAHLDAAKTRWESGPAHTASVSRAAITQYVTEELDLVDPAVAGELHCSVDPNAGDGFYFQRSGRVLAIYGENLFKFAPLLGQRLARAALDGSTPASVTAP